MPTPASALVTGASSGIGRSIAEALAQSGLRVFGTSREPDGGDPPAGVDLLPLDVRSDASVAACLALVAERGPALDVLVNNAGYALRGAVEEVSVEEAKEQFETNLFGVMRMVRAVLPGMRERRRGTIVNLSSLAGLVPAPVFWGVYSASKYALEGYTEHLWREVGPFGVRVALVEPGPVRTALVGNGREPARPIPAYAEWRKRADTATNRGMEKGIGPEVVARTVAAIVRDPSPRLRYRLGPEATWIPRLRAVVPAGIFERQLAAVFDVRGMR